MQLSSDSNISDEDLPLSSGRAYLVPKLCRGVADPGARSDGKESLEDPNDTRAQPDLDRSLGGYQTRSGGHKGRPIKTR